MQQRRHEESAFPGISVDDLEVVAAAENDFGLTRQIRHALANFVALPLACQRTHADFL